MDMEHTLFTIEMMYRNGDPADDHDIATIKHHIKSRYGKLGAMYPNMSSLGRVKAICLFKNEQTPSTKYIIDLDLK